MHLQPTTIAQRATHVVLSSHLKLTLLFPLGKGPFTSIYCPSNEIIHPIVAHRHVIVECSSLWKYIGQRPDERYIFVVFLLKKWGPPLALNSSLFKIYLDFGNRNHLGTTWVDQHLGQVCQWHPQDRYRQVWQIFITVGHDATIAANLESPECIQSIFLDALASSLFGEEKDLNSHLHRVAAAAYWSME